MLWFVALMLVSVVEPIGPDWLGIVQGTLGLFVASVIGNIVLDALTWVERVASGPRPGAVRNGGKGR